MEVSWRLHADIERVLNPTHWLPAPPDVVVEYGAPARALTYLLNPTSSTMRTIPISAITRNARHSLV